MGSNPTRENNLCDQKIVILSLGVLFCPFHVRLKSPWRHRNILSAAVVYLKNIIKERKLNLIWN